MIGLLDLNDDILNKIKHEIKILEREEDKNVCFKNADKRLKEIEQYKNDKKKYRLELGAIIYNYLEKCCLNDKEIDEYIKTRDLDKYFKKIL